MATSDRGRTVARRALLAFGGLLTLVALVAGTANRELLDANRFARHADQVRVDPDVSARAGDLITTRVLALDPDLVALRPLIATTAAGVVRSPVFSPIVRASARQVHQAMTRPGSQPVVLSLADVGAVLTPTLRALAPQLADQLPADFDVRLAQVGARDFAADTLRAAHLARVLSWALPAAAALCFLGAVLLSRDRRRTGRQVGAAIAVAGLALGLLVVVGNVVLGGQDRGTLRGALTAAVWGELGATLWPAVVVALGAGVLLVGSGQWALVVDRTRHRAVALARRPFAGRRVVESVLVALAGVALLAWPDATARLVAVVAGVVLLVLALAHLSPARPEGESAAAPEAGEAPTAPVAGDDGATRVRRRRAVPAATAGIAVAALVALTAFGAQPALLPDEPQPTTPVARPCNGDAALCGRTYDQVSYAATHNSMAAADEPNWFFTEQPTGLVGQLDDGIRALLIDTWPGQTTQRPGVITTAGPQRLEGLADADATWGPELVSSALRVRDAAGLTPTGPVEPYLCHGLCELGATLLEPEMERVHDWMVAHPREVVTFIVQDEGVTPEQTADVLDQAGLLPFVHTQQAGQPWPTLGAMIDSGQRLVVLAENEGGGTAYPWLLQAFDWVQDTPYSFTSADQFTCDLYRGPADAPLLLVNHWLSNPLSRVTDSAAVNAEGLLEPRVEQCARERDHIPNFVAVNFYDVGDVLAVVDRLNGLG